MSDAARQVAGGLHPLAVQQLFFEFVAARGVHAGSGHAHGGPRAVSKCAPTMLDPAQRAIAADHAVLERNFRGCAAHAGLHGLMRARAIVRVHQLEVRLVGASEARLRDAKHLVHLRAPDDLVTFDQPVPAAHARRVHRSTQALVALVQGGFDRAPRGQVLHRDHAHRPALIDDGFGAGFDQASLAGLGNEDDFRGAAGPCRADAGQHLCSGLGRQEQIYPVLPDQLLARVAEQAEEGLVGLADDAIFVDEHRFTGGFGQRTKALLTLAQSASLRLLLTHPAHRLSRRFFEHKPGRAGDNGAVVAFASRAAWCLLWFSPCSNSRAAPKSWPPRGTSSRWTRQSAPVPMRCTSAWTPSTLALARRISLSTVYKTPSGSSMSGASRPT